MLTHAKINSLEDIDWDNWQAKDPATLVFVVKDGQILLIRKKRGLGAGKINGPGGKLEPGETPEQCATREVQEELHITPHNLTYHGENLFQFVNGYSIHVHVYTTGSFEGTPTETEEAIPVWFPVDAIPYSEMWADDEIWLPLVLEGKKIHGRYIFDDDTMLDYSLTEK
ncbi:8-oxo-dGTP diphosphatase [Parendozoicomonas sp. Alg238-R29]|uniref:8-oxo-dGTP diphosphatase n=1 Tax=Parendozoicomonas sp. Alg238-R29 TaxID=2993446 RepID=UPI00248D4E1D|nr:8-oxo-dGTP diphosphatase [Parendozoicomonas sp. Alg238-R29]